MRQRIMLLSLLFIVSCKPKSFLPCEESVFWEAVRQAESGGNDKLIFEESDGNLSVGRFQLSISDKAIYGCDFNKMADLFDPVKNTKCKDLIVAKLRSKYPDESYQKALGRYWATLRGPEWGSNWREKSWKNFVSEAQKLGCEI